MTQKNIKIDRLHYLSPADLISSLRQQSLSQQELQAAILQAARRSLRHFAFFVIGTADWRQIKTEVTKTGELIPSRYTENWHILAWYFLLQSYRRIAVLAARGSRKSGTFSWTYPLWRAFANPGSDGLLVSASEGQTAENLQTVKRVIEASPILSPLGPAGGAKQWGALDIHLSNGSRIHARGSGAAIRGLHPAYAVVDDILDERNSGTVAQRHKVRDWVRKVIDPMLTSASSQMVVVGTPQAHDDLLMELKTDNTFIWTRFPALLSPADLEALRPYAEPAATLPEIDESIGQAYLWRSKMGQDFLTQKRRSMDYLTFAQEYLCSPASSEHALFRREWILTFEPQLLDLDRRRYGDEKIEGVYMGVDLAISTSKRADYFAAVTVGVTPTKYLIIDAFRGKLSFQGQLNKIQELYRRFRHDQIIIEAVAYQAALPQQLIKDTLLPVRAVRPHASKEVRAQRLSVYLENGQVLFHPSADEMIAEFLSFPLGTHDDLVDALGYAIAAHQGAVHTKVRSRWG